MLFWIVKIAIISAIIIYLIHNILYFLYDTLTVPKVQDLVQITNKNYENICDILVNNNNLLVNNNLHTNSMIGLDPSDLNISATPISLLPTTNMTTGDDNDAKLELQNYLKSEFR